MATDKLSNMREPVISLDLDIKEKTGMKHVLVELNKDELKELITSLEAANKVQSIISYTKHCATVVAIVHLLSSIL